MAVGLHPYQHTGPSSTSGLQIPSWTPSLAGTPQASLLSQCHQPQPGSDLGRGRITPVMSIPPSSEGCSRAGSTIPQLTPSHAIPFSPTSHFPSFFDHKEAPEEKLHQNQQPSGSGARHMHTPSSNHALQCSTATALPSGAPPLSLFIVSIL